MQKILIASSSNNFLDRNVKLLSSEDVLIYTATTGMEALRIHQQERCDLIIAELHISGMGGDELCSFIRKDNDLRAVSVILTCHGTPGELNRVARCGANAWVIKPVRPEKLLENVTKLLKISKRILYRVPLKAKALGTKGDEPFFCTMRNVSASGMLIETEQLLVQGDQITCLFSLPASREIVAAGEAVRSLHMPDGLYQYGVQFIDLSPEFSEEIEKFVANSHG